MFWYKFDDGDFVNLATLDGRQAVKKENFTIDNPGGETSLTFKFMTYETEGQEYCYVDELYIYGDTSAPTTEPTRNPTTVPTAQPSMEPTILPTAVPSESTYSPTMNPLLQSQEPSFSAATEEPTDCMYTHTRH